MTTRVRPKVETDGEGRYPGGGREQVAMLPIRQTPDPDAPGDRLRGIIEQCGAGIDVDLAPVCAHALRACLAGESLYGAVEEAIRSCMALVEVQPEYSLLAAALQRYLVDLELAAEGVASFVGFVHKAASLQLLNARTRALLDAHCEQFAGCCGETAVWPAEYAGLVLLCERYLLRNPASGRLIESPSFFLVRAAAGLSDTLEQALELHALLRRGEYLTSNLFNAGSANEQLCSCFILGPPPDSLDGIYDQLKDTARIAQRSGGIGLAYHSVRSDGSRVNSTNGTASGVVPWLKLLDSSTAAVNQGGRRKGATCVYLETWHADIEDFLALRDGTGAAERRTYHLQLANWIPDRFMRCVEADAEWSLFDPVDVPHLSGLWGERFDRAYEAAVHAGKAKKTLRARVLYAAMLRTLGETGSGWLTFKDACNRKCNQTARPQNVVQLSNLCTEITEVTRPGEYAVCTLGSVNLSRHLADGTFDYCRLARTIRTAVQQLDRVIDRNAYPLPATRRSNLKWRPVGLGMMGLQDLFFALRLPFDSEAALQLSTRLAEHLYFHALAASCELARLHGPHPAFAQTRASDGLLQFDLWQARPGSELDWDGLRRDIARHGLRNSLLIAVAPTVTIAALAGCHESIEPQFSNLYRRETSSGEFVVLNRYLVKDLRRAGLWTPAIRAALKRANGSVQDIGEIPAEWRRLYRTVWELPQKALIDLAAARGPFVDQSQSLNLFLESPTLDTLSSMYMYAWKAGLKTTYYLRSRPATRVCAAVAGVETPVCEACQ
ncbi:ribonucleoside-diphosphate reductase alpha chain [Tahibacter aquaticus]|uniref:Ribonucleoside-diphosphate reductase alpha chain n=1 Tax=Tahibacter aquaticus TaxID=520092 RepID=A0A4R6Z6T7_9GAMM|nr:ribonucleoside-diphosphate reductase subunit alpha [Tahibacter aquaticus]TDR47490.1 ribonucleoside-diphosphate reductase alpha chain [Tahibacter aquaticus]